MELAFIREFVALAEIRKFSAAAQHLHISQSTLSRHIQALEAELGCTLFERTTRDVELSTCGALYLPYAKKIAHIAGTADARLQEYCRQQRQTIQIGVVHNPDMFQIIDYLMEFQNLHPEYPMNIQEGTVSDLSIEFAAGRLKLITITCAEWEPLPERFVPAGNSRLCALLSERHPLAQMQRLPLQALSGQNLILPEKNNIVYQYLHHSLQHLGIHPNVFYQGSSSGVSAPLRSGMGVMIQDRTIAERYLQNGILLRELEPSISYVFGLSYAETLRKPEQAFVQFICQKYTKH